MDTVQRPWRQYWSVVWKTQLIATGLGASITAIFILSNRLDIGPPEHSPMGYYYFYVGVTILGFLPHSLGLPNDAPQWKWETFALFLNTAFCFALGTAIGFLLTTFRSRSGVQDVSTRVQD